MKGINVAQIRVSAKSLASLPFTEIQIRDGVPHVKSIVSREIYAGGQKRVVRVPQYVPALII